VTAVSATNLKCLEIKAETLLQLLREDRFFMERFLSFELHQRQLAVATMANLLFLSSEERLTRILLLLEDSYKRGNSTQRSLP